MNLGVCSPYFLTKSTQNCWYCLSQPLFMRVLEGSVNRNNITMLLVFAFTRHGGAKKDSERMPESFYSAESKKADDYSSACSGAKEDRTPDPLLAKQVLSQLSYNPIR